MIDAPAIDGSRHRRGPPGVALAVGSAIALALMSTFLLVLTPALSDRPGLQTLWVLFSLVMLKVPLLLLVWWMIVRRRGRRDAEVTHREPAATFIARVEREAALATRAPDAASRLARLRTETWAEIERADDLDTPALVELALSLEGPGANRAGGRLVSGAQTLRGGRRAT